MTETLRAPRESPVAPAPPPSARPTVYALVGAAAAFASAALIWLSRSWEPTIQYVSQLGATGMPTAPVFNTALLLLAVAAVLVDRAATASRTTYVAGWPVAFTLLICGMCFGLASVVTCSRGCPVPFTPGALPQDTIHIAAAVLGFVLAIVAMGQVALLRRRPWMRATSLVILVAVGVTAFAGAMIALFRGDTGLGGNLEFTAATLAIVWFGVFALQIAGDERASRERDEVLTASSMSSRGDR